MSIIKEGNYYYWEEICQHLKGMEIIVTDRQFKDDDLYFKLVKICDPKVDFTWHEYNIRLDDDKNVSSYYVKDNLGVDNDMCIIYGIKSYDNVEYKVKSIADLIKNHFGKISIICDRYEDDVATFATVFEIKERCGKTIIDSIYEKYNTYAYPLTNE